MKRRKIFRWFLYIISAGFVIALVLRNIEPFGLYRVYSSNNPKEISQLGPKTRVSGQKIIDDLVYFTLSMPYKFDSAKVKITLQNPYEDQQLHLGFQDQNQWHYDSKVIDIPFLDLISWNKLSGSPNIFQRGLKFKTVEDFINNPPQEIIGSFNFDSDTLGISKTSLPDYLPSKEEITINTPLRGKQVLYAYVANEPFKMWIKKQDLNWYEDPDPVTIKIYKDNELVYTATIADDGIDDASGKVLPTQEVYIQNPGPELPERGVYKIVIDGTSDTIITSIKTNLHKIILEGPIYLAENKDVFPKIVKETNANLLFTNVKRISAKTYHGSTLQDIKIASDGARLRDILATPSARTKKVASPSAITLKLDNLNLEVATGSASEISQVYVPKSDVILNGFLGYFAFDKSQLFFPTAYSIVPITNKENLDKVNYILTKFNPPKIEGEWKVTEVEFDFKNAVIKNGRLSFLIKAPNLKENGREVIIKSIEVQAFKKPMINLPNWLSWII